MENTLFSTHKMPDMRYTELRSQCLRGQISFMEFTKMHGLGNDYIYINCFKETIKDPAGLAKRLSDRHFGIGSDGLILIRPSQSAEFKMEIYNADGSRAGMCGNGIRCLGKYVYENKMTSKTGFDVETGAGIRSLKLEEENGVVKRVCVDMGTPRLNAHCIPVMTDKALVIDEPFEVRGKKFRITCLSMGNPHAVVYVKDVWDFPVEKLGPEFECHPQFPEKVNTEFIRVVDRGTIEMRVWERGSGETFACGTGACAAVVASVLNNLTDEEVTVKLLGGELYIRWDRFVNKVYMTGPAVHVFDGVMMLGPKSHV